MNIDAILCKIAIPISGIFLKMYTNISYQLFSELLHVKLSVGKLFLKKTYET